MKLYYEIDLGGPVSVGAHSYIGDSFEFIGALHPFASSRVPYIVNPDPSTIRSFDPDVIVYEQKLGERATTESVKARLKQRGLEDLRAVKDNKIVVMEYDSLAHYGPSFFSALETMVEKVKSVLHL